MPIICGSIVPQISSVKLLQSWRNRRGNEISPRADLRIDGDRFQITYSSSWALQSLKHSFQLEVNKFEPRAVVNWFQAQLQHR